MKGMKQKPAQQSKLNIQLRPASVEEAGLFYSQMEEGEDQALGTVGHLRMDFGQGGGEFWATWWAHNADHLTTPEFQKELQQVVDELHRSGPLKDLKAMRSYCGSHGGAIEDDGATYGYIAETDHYRYCLRCTPLPGHYQGYLYCYDLRQQQLTQKEALVSRVTYAGGEEQTFMDAQKYLDTIREELPYTAATVEQYRKHPYVQTATREKIELNKAFFEAAAPIAVLAFDDILRVFDIDPEIFSVTERYRMSRVLAAWATPADRETINASPTRKILRNRMRALDSIVEKGFLQIGDIVSSLNVLQKKSLCLWLRDLPSDPGRKYSVRKILSLMKISRASYYAILKNGTYGQSVVQRNAQDEQDAELIRTVMEYKGFAKGSRQIYMMMPALTGKRMGLKKIRRIMKTYNLTSSIQKAAPSKRMGGAALKKNVRPNLLQRRFRLYRPNEVRLTDVTHLLYGDGCKAYGSALLDPVTSKLVAFLVSEHNDLELALATLRQSDFHPCVSGGLYHSDQGTVYLSGAFQQEVSKRGYTQSMSKRGNCQDNAPQESFFGHFKDECPYSECKDIEELKELVARYAEYYNYERRMWDKGRMTPVEYEQYLLAMNEAEFSLYIAKEEEKYQQMKEKAVQRAIERAKNLGV